MSIESQQDKIDEYLLGTSSAEDREALERALADDEALRNELAETELAMAAIEINEDAALKARLQRLEAGLPGVATTPQDMPTEQGARVVEMKPRTTPKRTWLAIAASVLLLIAAGWFLLRQPTFDSPAELAMANFVPYDNIAYTFERGSSDDSILASAFRAYEAGDFITAAGNFKQVPVSGISSFYLGQSLLAQEDFSGAEPIFEELSQSISPFRQESEYYLALARVGLGRQGEAKAILQNITKQSNHVMEAEAKRLLEQL